MCVRVYEHNQRQTNLLKSSIKACPEDGQYGGFTGGKNTLVRINLEVKKGGGCMLEVGVLTNQPLLQYSAHDDMKCS